jgi:hypothetical protein
MRYITLFWTLATESGCESWRSQIDRRVLGTLVGDYSLAIVEPTFFLVGNTKTTARHEDVLDRKPEDWIVGTWLASDGTRIGKYL